VVEEEGDILARTLRKVREEEEEGDILAQTLRKARKTS
jgi:NADH:ubiquinone oxidoreductase subunit D